MNRWWIYQRERFPLFAHGPLIVAFSFSAVCFSALLRGTTEFPFWKSAVVAFLTSLFSFLHLRIADEFKDLDEDTRFRPYRPVPRGLVKLRELAAIWIATALVQLALALWLHPWLLAPLAATWIYLALMSREFFVRAWLKARPFTYMWTHMLIMPLVDFYATACDWMPAGAGPPRGLFWFVAASFFNGFVLEIGRKIRAPENEEHGVETYSVVWGRRGAVLGWLVALALTGFSAALAASRIGFLWPLALGLGALLALAGWAGARFLRVPSTPHARQFENLSGAWTLALY